MSFGGFGAPIADEFGLATLSMDAKRRLNALKNLEITHSKLNRDFLKELSTLEKKYHAKYQPIFNKRSDIVNGQHEPTEEETKVPEYVQDYTEITPEDGQAQQEGPVSGIPKFWLTGLLNHPHIAATITEKDQEVLSHLKDIKVSYLSDNPGFSLEFVFGENDYFTNPSITKTYYLAEPDVTTGDENEYVFERAEASPIEWKVGNDLTVTVEMRKQRHKDTNKTRVVKRTVPADTFFNFFKSRSLPTGDAIEDEDALEELEAELEVDYQVGEEFKDKIVPQALAFFTGEADVGFDEDEDFDFDGREIDDDDDDDDDVDE